MLGAYLPTPFLRSLTEDRAEERVMLSQSLRCRGRFSNEYAFCPKSSTERLPSTPSSHGRGWHEHPVPLEDRLNSKGLHPKLPPASVDFFHEKVMRLPEPPLGVEDLRALTHRPAELPRTTIVLFVAQVNELTGRALVLGNSLAADRFEAVTVTSDSAELERLRRSWTALGVDVPLVVIANDSDEFVRPAEQYVHSLGPRPNHTVIALIPELVVEHWYQKVLHNQTGARLKAALMEIPWVVVINVGLSLSSQARKKAPGPRVRQGRHGRRSRTGSGPQGRE